MAESPPNWDPFVLLLIDVQQDFLTAEISKAFPDYEKNVSSLLNFCRLEGIDVVHMRASFRQDKSDWMAKYKLLDRIPCIDGTPGAEVCSFAKDVPGEKVIIKQAFDGFHNPDLPSYLVKNKKRFILVAGLITSVCLLLTAANAAQRGYLVGMVEDCCADEPEAHEHTLERYPFIFYRTTVEQISTDREKWLADLNKLANR